MILGKPPIIVLPIAENCALSSLLLLLKINNISYIDYLRTYMEKLDKWLNEELKYIVHWYLVVCARPNKHVFRFNIIGFCVYSKLYKCNSCTYFVVRMLNEEDRSVEGSHKSGVSAYIRHDTACWANTSSWLFRLAISQEGLHIYDVFALVVKSKNDLLPVNFYETNINLGWIAKVLWRSFKIFAVDSSYSIWAYLLYFAFNWSSRVPDYMCACYNVMNSNPQQWYQARVWTKSWHVIFIGKQ